jgi:YbbR domain-containing protein
VDGNGGIIQGLTLTPDQVKMTVNVVQSGGYRDVAVKVETVGQPISGYRVTNIIISPPTVTLFSSDPQVVAEMPGYVSTQPLDLTEIDDDKEVRLTLDLPSGVTIVGEEQSVQVQIGIAAVETSISLSVPITVIGLGTGLEAVVSPESVDIFLTGPLPILDDLTSEDVLIYVDLTDLEPGSHLVEPQVEILSDRVVQEAINPDTIEITISESGGG